MDLPPLNVITNGAKFHAYLMKINWHEAFLRHVSYTPTEFAAIDGRAYPNGRTGGVGFAGIAVLRILLAFPCQGLSLELVAFDPTYQCLQTDLYFEDQQPNVVVQIARRTASMVLGAALSINAEAFAYRELPYGASGAQDFYFTQEFRDKQGILVHPYNVDYKAALDEALHPYHCCDQEYFCPTSNERECPLHSGFDVCCNRPDLHEPLTKEL